MNTTGTSAEPVLHIAWSFDNTWLKELSVQLQLICGHPGELSENTLTVPPAFGNGYFKHWRPEPALSVIYVSIKVNRAVLLKRVNKPGDKYVLIGFNGSGHGIYYHFNQQLVYLDYMRRYSAYYNTSDTPTELRLEAGQHTGLLLLLIKTDYLESLLTAPPSHDNWLAPGLFQVTPELHESIASLDKNLHDNGADYFYIKGSINKLLALTLPVIAGNGPQQHKPEVQKIMQLVNDLLRDLTRPYPHISEAAAMVDLSPSKFKSIFLKVYKQSYYGYLQSRKLEKAKELLLQENQSVTAVAYSLGYSSCSHFTRLFRKKFRVAPQAYKQNQGKP